MKMFSAFVAAPRNALESPPPTRCRQRPFQEDWSNQICRSSASFAACRFSPVVNFAKFQGTGRNFDYQCLPPPPRDCPPPRAPVPPPKLALPRDEKLLSCPPWS